LTILDTLGRAHPFGMVEDEPMRAAVAAADQFADETNTCLLCISHTPGDVATSDDVPARKRKGLAAGTTALENTARSNSGMVPMGEDDAKRRGVSAERRGTLAGVTVRKANDAPEGGWHWFERVILEVETYKRDGTIVISHVPAVKRAYKIGPAPAATPTVDEDQFLRSVADALEGVGRISLAEAARLYLEKTPAERRIAGQVKTVQRRLEKLPGSTPISDGTQTRYLHVVHAKQRRWQVWVDGQEELFRR
jgi:hypothetical protein